jgi:hypothetical protein
LSERSETKRGEARTSSSRSSDTRFVSVAGAPSLNDRLLVVDRGRVPVAVHAAAGIRPAFRPRARSGINCDRNTGAQRA